MMVLLPSCGGGGCGFGWMMVQHGMVVGIGWWCLCWIVDMVWECKVVERVGRCCCLWIGGVVVDGMESLVVVRNGSCWMECVVVAVGGMMMVQDCCCC